MTRWDVFCTPLVEAVLIALAVVSTMAIMRWIGPQPWLELLVVGYLFLAAWTLVLLALLRRFFSLPEGVYSFEAHALKIYRWKLYEFLCVTNLSLFYSSGLLPIPMRQLLYKALGVKMGKGMITIAGHIGDAHYVTVEENAILGDDCYISPHAIMATGRGHVLVIRRINIRRNSIVGARSILLPGVTVGEGAMVSVQAQVPMFTAIPDGAVWLPGQMGLRQLGENKD